MGTYYIVVGGIEPAPLSLLDNAWWPTTKRHAHAFQKKQANKALSTCALWLEFNLCPPL